MVWASFWAILYCILVVTLPANLLTVQQFHLSETQFHILALLTGLPIIMVWFTAFFGCAALADYAEKVQDTREGKSYVKIAKGLTWLSWGLPVSSCLNTLLGGLSRLNPNFQSGALIISHYIYLLIALAAFTFMSDGSRGLRDIVHKLPSKGIVRLMMVASTFASVAYCALTARQVRIQHLNSYHLPLWLILLTIIIPYLYAWQMGFFAVFEISQYRRTVRGLLYKQGLGLLASGATFTIVASVALQFLTSSSRYLRRIELNWRLVAAYLIMITFAIGFILITAGASKLKKIEEV
jgi:hypothetical protein